MQWLVIVVVVLLFLDFFFVKFLLKRFLQPQMVYIRYSLDNRHLYKKR